MLVALIALVAIGAVGVARNTSFTNFSGRTLPTISSWAFAAAGDRGLVTATVIDMRTRRIPNAAHRGDGGAGFGLAAGGVQRRLAWRRGGSAWCSDSR